MGYRERRRSQKATIIGTHMRSSQTARPRTSQKKMDYYRSRELCGDYNNPPPYTQKNLLRLQKVNEGVITFTGGGDAYFLGSFLWARSHWNSWPVAKRVAGTTVQDLVNPSASYLAPAISRASNPGATIDYIELVKMTRDLTRIIGQVGKFLSKFDASSLRELHLLKEFGVDPMISDIKTLIEAQRAVARRAKSKRGTSGTWSKRVQLNKSEFTRPAGILSHADSGLDIKWSCYLEEAIKQEIWAVVSFAYKVDHFKAPDWAKQKVKRIDFDAPITSIWNAIPWSFLVDYFVNISSVLARQNGATVSDVCIMRKIDSRLIIKRQWQSRKNALLRYDIDGKFRLAHSQYHSKKRDVYYGDSTRYVIPVTFGLTLSQVANIIALFTGGMLVGLMRLVIIQHVAKAARYVKNRSQQLRKAQYERFARQTRITLPGNYRGLGKTGQSVTAHEVINWIDKATKGGFKNIKPIADLMEPILKAGFTR